MFPDGKNEIHKKLGNYAMENLKTKVKVQTQ